MPTYVYEIITEDGEEGQIFEIMQRLTDPPLTHHPLSGLPCRRVITAPSFNTDHSPAKEKKMLSDSNLDRLGFTKYVKQADGEYVKTAGKGPSMIRNKSDGSAE